MFSLHYALLFGGFAGASLFCYIWETGGMQGSILDLIRWPVVIACVALLALHRFLDQRLPMWLGLDSRKAKGITGVCVSVLLFVELAPPLDAYHEHRQHPIAKLTRSTWEAQSAGKVNDGPLPTSIRKFDYSPQLEQRPTESSGGSQRRHAVARNSPRSRWRRW